MITTIYAAILALMFFAMNLHIVRGRWKYQVPLGDGGNEDLRRRIRVQGNFVEYVPFALLLMLFAELEAVPIWTIHALGITLIIARKAHAYAIYNADSALIWRIIGTAGSNMVIVLAALLGIYGFIF